MEIHYPIGVDLHFRKELWVEEISLGILVISMVIKSFRHDWMLSPCENESR